MNYFNNPNGYGRNNVTDNMNRHNNRMPNDPAIPQPTSEQNESTYDETKDIPVTPLPNPGEGGPVFDETQNIPVTPLPNPGEGGPVYDENQDMPVIPLPNPGEGGPVYSGPIITVPSRPVIPCFFCTNNSNGNLRFLNAASGYQTFVVYISGREAVRNLEYAEVSDYGRVTAGYQTITVAAKNGYIYISKQIRVTVGSKITVAIVNIAGGLDLIEINDVVCNTPLNGSCIRACNLSYNVGPLNFYFGNQILIFSNVNFTDVTNYRRILPGTYFINITSGREALVTTELTTRSNSQYTIYCFNWSNEQNAIRTLVVEDRK